MPRISDTFLKRDRAKTAVSWMTMNEVKFKIANILNEGYQNFVDTKMKRLSKSNTNEDYIEEEVAKALAEFILLDWENLDNDDGTPMECTIENKVKVLTEYTSIAVRIIAYASNMENFVSANFDEAPGLDEELGN